jgi:hypothetical protein
VAPTKARRVQLFAQILPNGMLLSSLRGHGGRDEPRQIFFDSFLFEYVTWKRLKQAVRRMAATVRRSSAGGANRFLRMATSVFA